CHATTSRVKISDILSPVMSRQHSAALVAVFDVTEPLGNFGGLLLILAACQTRPGGASVPSSIFLIFPRRVPPKPPRPQVGSPPNPSSARTHMQARETDTHLPFRRVRTRGSAPSRSMSLGVKP